MNKSAFLQLIQQVSGITDQQTDELEKVATAFPYCQTAHLLLAKSAYDKGSMLSSQRLRRASSYATNRQLLKKLIYAPAPVVPVFEEAFTSTEQVGTGEQHPQEYEAAAEEAMVTAAAEVQQSSAASPDNQEEPEPAQQEEESPATLQDGTTAETNPATPAEDTSKEELYSELAMLLTINSLSSSSTDLLVASPDKTAVASTPFFPELLPPTEEAPEAEPVEIPLPVVAPAPANPSLQEEAETEKNAAVALPADEDSGEEKQQEQAFGEVNYSSDEIDRLYAEDALGYWMGSSRMGEVLQIKDDFTRQKPQSFHPELILEYSKTHELEKAIQPATNILSQQLDIIDQFLKLNPRLKTMANLKMKTEPQEDLSLKSSRIRKGMASENLASIFLKQGKVKKAVKIYEQLILKYPEKKSYFAEQIEKLQNLN